MRLQILCNFGIIRINHKYVWGSNGAKKPLSSCFLAQVSLESLGGQTFYI